MLTNAVFRRHQAGHGTAGSSAGPGTLRDWVHSGRWLSVVSVLSAFAAWTLLNAFRLVPSDLLPGPGEVFKALIDILDDGYRGTTLWQNILATLYRCLGGFILACMAGIPLGLAMGYNSRIRAAFDYIIQFMRPLPPLSYLILLILWLGTGDTSKIALLYLTAFPIVASSAMSGVWSVKAQKVQAARSLGAGEWQIFLHVIFPSALPLIFTGADCARCHLFHRGRGRTYGRQGRPRLDGVLGQSFSA